MMIKEGTGRTVPLILRLLISGRSCIHVNLVE